MMYIHYCKQCERIHMLNGHKMFCPKCEHALAELKMSYIDYMQMGHLERTQLLSECHDERRLSQLTTHYRMYKYSKWYKQLQKAGSASSDRVNYS